jgi:hypothetical protein
MSTTPDVSSCGLCESPLEDGYLCVGCTKATRVRLEAMPTLYGGLAVLLAPAGGTSGIRSGKGGPPPLPVREDILDMRSGGGIVASLESWVDAIRHERGRQEAPHPGSPTGRITRAVAELLGHMPWVAVSWPEAGLFASEIRSLARSASSIIRPPAPESGTRIGNCPAQFEDGAICGAVLRLGPGEKVVMCRWCETTYPPAMWTGLKVLIDVDAANARHAKAC